MKHIVSVFVCASLALTASTAAESKRGRPLLAILIDGLGWDYLQDFDIDTELKGFKQWMDNGVKADYLQPVFPSSSFPNYYSLMTGLYPGTHGMTDNLMYDEIHNTSFMAGGNPEQYESYWWDGGDPLWITARRQGKSSYMWYWCGCEVTIRGLKPDYCSSYHDDPNPSWELFSSALDEALEVLANGTADFAGVYLEKLDKAGHNSGPHSAEIIGDMRKLDTELARIQQLLNTKTMKEDPSTKLADAVNVMLFSDHGMTSMAPGEFRIDVLNDVEEDIERIVGYRLYPMQQIWPKEGQLMPLYNAIKDAHPNLTVYLKEDIPHRYHFAQHYRVPPLYLLADEGYLIVQPGRTGSGGLGDHGYENFRQSMRGVFFAQGPDFKKGHTMDGFINIELYQIMCFVLGVDPSPNYGTWQHVNDMLISAGGRNQGPYCILAMFIGLLISPL